MNLTVNENSPQQGIDSLEISGPAFQYAAFYQLRVTLDTTSVNTGYDPKQCSIKLKCSTIYTRLAEVLRLSDPSNPMWLLQIPSGVLLVVIADHLTRNLYIRVVAGGLSG